MFSTFVKSNGSGYDLQKWFPENRKTSYRINIFEKFQVLFMFSTIVSQTEVFTTSVNSFQKTGSSYDVVPNQHFFRTNFKFYACFRPLSSQMEAFTASRNSFQKTGSSYNVVSNQHFRKISSPVHVCDYYQSNGSVYDLRK